MLGTQIVIKMGLCYSELALIFFFYKSYRGCNEYKIKLGFSMVEVVLLEEVEDHPILQ